MSDLAALRELATLTDHGSRRFGELLDALAPESGATLAARLASRAAGLRSALAESTRVAANADERRAASRAADQLSALVESFDDRAREFAEQDERVARAARANALPGVTMSTTTTTPVYSRLLNSYRSRNEKAAAELRAEIIYGGGDGLTGSPYPDPRSGPHAGHSFFGDLVAAKRGDWAAAERLNRVREARAGDLSTGAGVGGQFAPPLWLVDEYVRLARAGRVTANLAHHEALPQGVSSVNIPKVATGTSTAVQSSENSALSDTAATTGAVSSGITTIGGKQIVSLQLLEQSGIPFDRVVLGDLSADAARSLDRQVLSGSGASGELEGLLTAGESVAFTSAAPVVSGTTPADSFLSAVNRAILAVATSRFLPADAVVMHPRRWAWVLEATDGEGRPLVVPDGPEFNAPGTASAVTAEGRAGTLLGLPVYVDANVPVDLGTGTDQDVAIVMRTDDVWLYESEPRLETFDATYADQASMLFRALQYTAMAIRYAGSVQVVGGTGMVAPTL